MHSTSGPSGAGGASGQRPAIEKPKTVADYLRHTPTLGPDDSVREAERALAAARVTALPVVDGERHLAGTVSQTELEKARSEPVSARESGELVTTVDEYADLESAPASARGTTVAEVMNRSPFTVGPDTRIETLASRMRERGVHEVPVVCNGVLVGVVSALEILDVVAESRRRDDTG